MTFPRIVIPLYVFLFEHGHFAKAEPHFCGTCSSARPLTKARQSKAMVIGILSDTHALLRSEAMDALAGTDLIIHAGDVGSLEIITGLREIAPVFAVRGN